MAGLPFALLHEDDLQKKMKEHLEKKAAEDSHSDCSTSGSSIYSSQGSASSSPCSSQCGSPRKKGLESELETTSQLAAPCASRWTTEELVNRQVLMEGEEIVLCGNVVRRGFPLLRKNVLMLTNMPRLLVLDPSGTEVLKQIPLRSDDTSLVAQGPRHFQVRTLDKTYDCRDATIGADVWTHHVQAARDKVKQARFF